MPGMRLVESLLIGHLLCGGTIKKIRKIIHNNQNCIFVISYPIFLKKKASFEAFLLYYSTDSGP